MEMEEDFFLTGFHQQVQNECGKSWNDRHIKLHAFKVNDIVLLYDINFTKFLAKFHMHWLGPYIFKEIMDGGTVHLVKLNVEPFPGKEDESRLMLYMGDPAQ